MRETSYSDFIPVHASGPGIGHIDKDWGTGTCRCGREFSKQAALHRYCSNACRKAAVAEQNKKYARKRKAAKKCES
jgi:hypothetical protein